MKTYRVEIQTLTYFDVTAASPEDAKKRVPKSYRHHIPHNSVQNGHCNFDYNHEAGVVFYEPFDVKNAEVIEDFSDSKVPVILR
jgi:hypothetical protein|tara:strand:+ start:185 stop:436 length:252 start_codon:yes stop_codon:yes gene_type:complete